MSNRDTIARMHDCLRVALQPTHLEINDDSQRHVGHPGAATGGGHFQLSIAAPAFLDHDILSCHRLIYQALSELMPQHIHALSIKILRN